MLDHLKENIGPGLNGWWRPIRAFSEDWNTSRRRNICGSAVRIAAFRQMR